MNTRLPLQGYGIIVTRPEEQAHNLCQLLEAAGGLAFRLPLLIVEGLNDSSTQSLCCRRDWDWILFISRNAVKYAASCFAPVEAPTRVAAIGQGTALHLTNRGIRVDLMPELEFNSEALLNTPEMGNVQGQKILIVRGQGGRELLGETLASRGARVDYAEVYRRAAAPIDPEPWRHRWQSGQLHALIVTSGEALDHLQSGAGDLLQDWMPELPLVTMSVRLAQRAREQGWNRVIAASRACDEALRDATLEAMTRTHGCVVLTNHSKNTNLTDRFK